MKLRIICMEQDTGSAAHVAGAQAIQRYETFLVDAPEVVKWLTGHGGFLERVIVGVQVDALEGEKP